MAQLITYTFTQLSDKAHQVVIDDMRDRTGTLVLVEDEILLTAALALTDFIYTEEGHKGLILGRRKKQWTYVNCKKEIR